MATVLVIPLERKIAVGVVLPFVIYEGEGIEVKITSFTSRDSENIFGYRIEELTNDRHRFRSLNEDRVLLDGKIFNRLGYFRSQVIIESSGSECVQEGHLIFILSCLLGESCEIRAHQMFIGGQLRWATVIGHARASRRAVNQEITELDLGDMGSLLNAIVPRIVTSKVETLITLWEVAMSTTNISVSCAFYMSILESLLVSESSNTEIKYKLSMRLAALRGEGYEFQEFIARMYVKRSNTFHGNGKLFTPEERESLETIAARVTLEYFKNPQRFTAEQLDRLLLSKISY